MVVEYADLPALLTIEEAIAANSFYENTTPNTSITDPHPGLIMECGDVKRVLAEAEHTAEGSVRTGGCMWWRWWRLWWL